MLHRDELILHRRRFFVRRLQHLQQGLVRLRNVAAGAFDQTAELRFGKTDKLLGIGPDFLQDGLGNSLSVLQHCREQVQRVQLGIPPFASERLAVLQGFLGLEGEFVEAKGHGGNPWVRKFPGPDRMSDFQRFPGEKQIRCLARPAATYVKSRRRKSVFWRAHSVSHHPPGRGGNYSGFASPAHASLSTLVSSQVIVQMYFTPILLIHPSIQNPLS